MKKFKEWVESHNVQQATATLKTDRSDLGSQGFEGLQDMADALKIVAGMPKGSSAMSSIVSRLSALVSQRDPDLAQRLRSTAQKFVHASRQLGTTTDQPLGNAAANQQNNQPPVRSAM